MAAKVTPASLALGCVSREPRNLVDGGPDLLCFEPSSFIEESWATPESRTGSKVSMADISSSSRWRAAQRRARLSLYRYAVKSFERGHIDLEAVDENRANFVDIRQSGSNGPAIDLGQARQEV
ncbi:hypothetical protein Amsp01_054080 [Amycolatopsis sp. NBRC 101858]|uniref:hypothetical protein n=1 Tax=Amycolatopsis sp. NBRC 101858 TaxID=3032200 RepID=UPI0024A01AD6|nr:hypothetical protein [Amycolatopsis sp. NBRC 101858]GLY39384.1 hypothetical protein Amsp01_054080 [Amycolatopsis sp. NBRC 101858]